MERVEGIVGSSFPNLPSEKDDPTNKHNKGHTLLQQKGEQKQKGKGTAALLQGSDSSLWESP